MSDVENRLADIERRLQRLELVGPPVTSAENVSAPPSTAVLIRNLAFWLGLVVLGVVIWIFSSNLAGEPTP